MHKAGFKLTLVTLEKMCVILLIDLLIFLSSNLPSKIHFLKCINKVSEVRTLTHAYNNTLSVGMGIGSAELGFTRPKPNLLYFLKA